MKSDIKNRADLETLIDSFYQKATHDELIKHFFTEVVQLNWQTHIPLIVDFWESSLFGSNNYKGNPMTAHLALNQKSPLLPQHFDRWLELWEATVNELFEGAMAEMTIARAKQIAQLMQFKIKGEV